MPAWLIQVLGCHNVLDALRSSDFLREARRERNSQLVFKFPVFCFNLENCSTSRHSLESFKHVSGILGLMEHSAQ